MFFITNPSLLLFCLTNVMCLLTAVHGVQQWPTQDQEAIDEINDIKLLKAVQTSMADWKLRKSVKHNRQKRADKSVCYTDLGCFEDSGPFGYLDMLPSSPEEINTKFMFYSTKNRGDKPLLEFSFGNVSNAWGESSKINVSNAETETTTKGPDLLLEDLEDLSTASLRVVIHGFGSTCNHVWIYEMRAALMAVESCVILCVDWENGASLPNYVKAAANSRLVGKQLAMVLRGLVEHRNLQMSRTHLIGFSLGGHVAGFAGAELNGLNRITGLDPAGPLFESQHPKARLDSTDATFVDVIHSNGENLILGGLGSLQPMGHVDFYPNGGRVQHGCSNIFVGAVTDFIWSPITNEGRSLCNHRRAYKFFIDSVAPRCLFPAFPCDSYDSFLEGKCFPCDKALESSNGVAKCGNMGYYADRSTGRGQLFLVTREEEPFCAHQYHVEIHNALNDLPLRTLGRIEITLEGEGGLNETFTMTEKDDTELFAGDIISRILVPHPALGFPTAVTLTYKSYSGWLSRGLPSWRVNKIMLTDSFGKSSSVCRDSYNLETGKSKRFSLKSGECHNSDELQSEESRGIKNKTNYEKLIDGSNSGGGTIDNVGPTYILDDSHDGPPPDNIDKKDVINLGKNYKLLKNFTYALSDDTDADDVRHSSVGLTSDGNLPWQPVYNENSLERETTDTSRSFSIAKEEIFEPILKVGPGKRSSNVREAHALRGDPEITEPVLRSTTQRYNRQNNQDFNSNEANNKRSFDDRNVNRARDSESMITVQLLPFRLGEILERAERYARLTLLPLITEQAPRFFGFDDYTTTNQQHEKENQPKYFPPLGDLVDEVDLLETNNRNKKRDNSRDTGNPGYVGDQRSWSNSKSNKNNYNNNDERINDDDIFGNINTTPKNLLEIFRVQNNTITASKLLQERSIISSPPTNYYTNTDLSDMSVETLQDYDDDDLIKTLRINLPTYRTPAFPYSFETPEMTDFNSDVTEATFQNEYKLNSTTTAEEEEAAAKRDISNNNSSNNNNNNNKNSSNNNSNSNSHNNNNNSNNSKIKNR